MVYTNTILIRSRRTAQDITDQIESLIQESGIHRGQIIIQTTELSTALLRAPRMQDKILQDIQKEIRLLIPARISFNHEESPEMTAGCIKSALFGSGICGIVSDSTLISGERLGIYFVDFDGPRACCCVVCIIGE